MHKKQITTKNIDFTRSSARDRLIHQYARITALDHSADATPALQPNDARQEGQDYLLLEKGGKAPIYQILVSQSSRAMT